MEKRPERGAGYDRGMSELTEAIKNGDAERVRALASENQASLASGENGVTPVLLAIYHGKPDIARLLVTLGAPLSFAERCALGQEEEALQNLTADRALLEQRSGDGHTPLGLAIFFGHGSLARKLIEAGADVNAAAANAQQVAPLHAAAAVRDVETARALLARGADPNARQQQGFTPLHGAASRGDLEMAALLLAHGADRLARTDDGLTAADVARKYGHPDFAEWLEGGG